MGRRNGPSLSHVSQRLTSARPPGGTCWSLAREDEVASHETPRARYPRGPRPDAACPGTLAGNESRRNRVQEQHAP